MSAPVLHLLREARREERGLLFILVDPDSTGPDVAAELARASDLSGADGFLVGGSLTLSDRFVPVLRAMKAATARPVVIFPGGYHHIAAEADAILFLTMLSSRNPDHLIGQQVLAAPLIARLKLEALSTAYLLIESDRVSTAEFMSYSKPLPRRKPDIAVAHALAAEMMGMGCCYLEAGSGAGLPVPTDMITAVHQACHLPLFVGGGITDPEMAADRVHAGATAIVVGTHFETSGPETVRDFARAVHGHSS